MRTSILRILWLGTVFWPAFAQTPKVIVIESAHFRYNISTEAKNLAFLDRASGTDYLARPGSPCASARIAGKEAPASEASMADGQLTLRFGDSPVRAVLKLETRPFGTMFRVESVSGGEIESLTFLSVPLTLRATPDERFGACALSLNLHTRVDALPALQRDLRASCEKKFGLVGARVAIVAAPMDKMLPTLQAALEGASELPVCNVAGPWAREIPFNHGSYLFNFGTMTETNLDDWIEMSHSLGFTQIDNHGGGTFFRFGDMELDRQKWPDGWESWRRIVGRLHAAGIGSIFHTYAFFIDKRSKYVTPIPDPRLDAFRSFTLPEPISTDATEMIVNESTAGMSTVTGFFEHNSTVLHLDDELVTFGAVSQTAPWRFTGLKRGALGTKASAHDRNAKARHLKECFGLFVPDPESSLFEEIAANHAEVVNRCNFDGVYLDAIDGSSILRGGDECWYWADKFVVEIQKKLKKPVGMEMSAMWHHFWQYRTRWQAWDYPQRGHKRFIDLHAAEVNGGLLLPLHLGWWGFQSFNPPQIEPTYPDVMENLGARLIGWDAGISLTAGVDRQALRNTPLFRRAVDILRTCEDIRHSRSIAEAVRARLREPGAEFALLKTSDGKTRFRRTASQARTVASSEPWTLAWPVTNAFAEQPIRLRIEALMSAGAAGDSNAVLLADLRRGDAGSFKQSNAGGVNLSVAPFANQSEAMGVLTATNAGKVPRNAAWVRLERRFEPVLNLKDHQGLGLEVEGEGEASGAVLAIRLESPHHMAFGAVADRYIDLDFEGRRSFTLVETESSRWNDFLWNDGKGLYNVYRETINFGAVESVSLWLQNLPPGRETRVRIGPVRALSLRPVLVRNPKLTVDGATIEFPVELVPGSWIECAGPEGCEVYGAKGESLGKVTPRGSWPLLRAGRSSLKFSSDAGQDSNSRARITVFSQGETL